MATEKSLLFRVLRKLLLFTGNGDSRKRSMNDLHHKLGHRLFRLLPTLGFPKELRIHSDQLDETMIIRTDDGGVSHKLLFYRTYEPFEAEVIRRAVRPGSVVYNIGANLGFYAVLAAKACGPEGMVVAIEPDDTNFQLLKRNTENFASVHTIQAAVTDRVSTVTLGRSEANFGDHRIKVGGLIPDSRKESIVDGVSIDALIEDGLPKPDIIIMDVQGAEGLVLGGFSVENQKPELVIITEFNVEAIVRSGQSAAEAFGRLLASGKVVRQIDEASKQLVPISLNEVLAIKGEINLYASCST